MHRCFMLIKGSKIWVKRSYKMQSVFLTEIWYTKDKRSCLIGMGGYIMATKSILKTIHIRSPKCAKRLVSALENAAGKASAEVHLRQAVSDASRSDIRKMFGGEK